jgi:hypothetical protein
MRKKEKKGRGGKERKGREKETETERNQAMHLIGSLFKLQESEWSLCTDPEVLQHPSHIHTHKHIPQETRLQSRGDASSFLNGKPEPQLPLQQIGPSCRPSGIGFPLTNI